MNPNTSLSQLLSASGKMPGVLGLWTGGPSESEARRGLWKSVGSGRSLSFNGLERPDRGSQAPRRE